MIETAEKVYRDYGSLSNSGVSKILIKKFKQVNTKMCWLFLIFNKFLHIIILALDLLKSLKPNAIFFNTFIK